MFARLKETYRILSYREPVTSGPDIVVVEETRPRVPRSSKIIATVIEAFVVVYMLGLAAGRVANILSHVPPTKVVSIATLAGALGALFSYLLHSVVTEVQKKIQTHLNLSDKLAPYFGRKLDSTFRVLSGH
jgi:hypothetical protein